MLIDGNEYTGWQEFVVVASKCRPKYVALHDANTKKTSRVLAYLMDSSTARAEEDASVALGEWELEGQGSDQAYPGWPKVTLPL